MPLVKGVVGNVFTVPSKEQGKEPRRVIQVITHDGLRMGLEDIADMSPGGYPCNVQDDIALDCRVTEFRGRIQYAYWGGGNGGGDNYLHKLFGQKVQGPGPDDVIPGGEPAKGVKGAKAPF